MRKSKRDALKRESKHNEDDEEIKDRYEKIKKEYEELGRSSSGVAQAFDSWVDLTPTVVLQNRPSWETAVFQNQLHCNTSFLLSEVV